MWIKAGEVRYRDTLITALQLAQGLLMETELVISGQQHSPYQSNRVALPEGQAPVGDTTTSARPAESTNSKLSM